MQLVADHGAPCCQLDLLVLYVREGGLKFSSFACCLLCRDLGSIRDREVCCYSISCKNSTNIDVVLDWLVKHSKTKA